MPQHALTRRVRHAPDDVFELVSDVRDYPRFIRWIRAMRVLDEDVRAGVGSITAEAVIGYKFVRERFTTRVDLNRDQGDVAVSLVRGPFRELANRWTLSALPDGSTRVEFWISYEFANPVLNALLSSNVDRAVSAIVSAFEVRAAQRFARTGDDNVDDARMLASVRSPSSSA